MKCLLAGNVKEEDGSIYFVKLCSQSVFLPGSISFLFSWFKKEGIMGVTLIRRGGGGRRGDCKLRYVIRILLKTSFSSFVSLIVKYTRDPSAFYANKIQKSLKEGETDTPGRIILTSSTVGLLHDRIKMSNFILSTDVIRTSSLKIATVNNLKNRLESELVGCKLVSNLLRLLRKKFVRGIWLRWEHRCCHRIQIARLQFCNSSNVVEYMGVVVKTEIWIHPSLIITPFSQATPWRKTFLLVVLYLHLVPCVCSF